MRMDRPRPSEMAGRDLVEPAEPPARLPGASAAELGRRCLVGFAVATAAYATFTVDTGMFWFRVSGWTPWEFDGVWRYTRSGVVPPVAGVTDPPGLYPSPHRPDRWEVWSGDVWTGVHRDPARR